MSLPTADAGPDVSVCLNDCASLTAAGAGAGGSYTWSNGDISSTINVCPNITTTYTVTVTDANGCTDSDEVIVRVYNLPIISILPESPAICRDSSIILTASGANSYEWIPSSGLSSTDSAVVIASPQTNITYSITGTSEHGCKGYGNVTVEVFPTPSSSLNNEVYICIDEFMILNPGDFDEQHWFLWSNGSTEQKIIVDEPGIYWIIISNPGCSIADTTIVNPCTEIWVPNSFTPDGNYINDIFKAEASTEFEEFHMTVFNRWGQQIFESNNVHKGWDGTYKGKLSQGGVYVWIIEYFTPGNQYAGKERKILKGTVTLIR